jgi:hypothetical protein
MIASPIVMVAFPTVQASVIMIFSRIRRPVVAIGVLKVLRRGVKLVPSWENFET